MNWNKNISGLLSSFAQFLDLRTKTYDPRPTTHDPRPKTYPARRCYTSSVAGGDPRTLILVGKAFLDKTLSQTREIDRMISDLKIGDHIIKTGYVDEDALSSLYTHARSLIQPSWYEGFGLPVLEAMSFGCLVVCSTSSSLPEIAGPSIMVDVNNQSSIVAGMKQVVSLSKEKRKALIDQGVEWVHKFTWKKVAGDTVKSYEKVLGNV